MKRLSPAAIYFIAALAIGLLLQNISLMVWSSWVDYTPPIDIEINTDASPTEPIVEHVIIVLVDGARPDLALRYGNESGFGTLYREGVWYLNAWAHLPTYSTPARAAISTGLPHELTGVSSNWYDAGELSIPNIFTLAREAGYTTVAIGDTSIKRLFGSSLTQYIEIPETMDHSRLAMEEAIKLIESNPPNLLWIGMASVDKAGHMYGAASEEYREALTESSKLLQDLIDTLVEEGLLPNTLLIVVSDHGHIDTGGHGDDEEEAQRIVLALYGGPTLGRTRVDKQFYYTAIAPTVAAILGLKPEIASDQPPLLYGMRGYITDRLMHYTIEAKKNYLSILERLVEKYGGVENEKLFEARTLIQTLEYERVDEDPEGFIVALNQLLEIEGEIYDAVRSRPDPSSSQYNVVALIIILVLGGTILYLLREIPLNEAPLPIIAGLAGFLVGNTYFTYIAGYYGTMSSVNSLIHYLTSLLISAFLAVAMATAILLMGRVWRKPKKYLYGALAITVMTLYPIANVVQALIQYGPLVRFPFPDWTLAYTYYTSLISLSLILLLSWIPPLTTYLIHRFRRRRR